MRYELRQGDSEVRVSAHAPFHTTHASSRGVTGEFVADLDADLVPAGEVGGTAEVGLESFSSGNPLLDMNTLRVLDTKRWPSARFRIGEVRAGDAPGRLTVRGTLDFHGSSAGIEAGTAVERTAGGLRITGRWTLSQKAFRVKPPRLAMLKVDDEVIVRFELVATASR